MKQVANSWRSHAILRVTSESLPSEHDLAVKRIEFAVAMKKYNSNPFYSRLEFLVSSLILMFQGLSVIGLIKVYDGTGIFSIFFTLIIAYILTDFINGLAHMYMDNNTHYTSIAGPFISSFHLHHLKPKYQKKHPLKIYFYSSGTKFWLLGYLWTLLILQRLLSLPYSINLCMVAIGILSCVAEVSHYWCHTSTKNNKIIKTLQKYRVLLPIKHHIQHHRADNTHYAFLNGVTDPLLNLISHYLYSGYKNNADQHIETYKKSI